MLLIPQKLHHKLTIIQYTMQAQSISITHTNNTFSHKFKARASSISCKADSTLPEYALQGMHETLLSYYLHRRAWGNMNA